MLTSLIRTSSCGFDLSNSLTLETLEAQIEQTTFQPIPPEIVLNHVPAVFLPAEIARRWCQGQRIHSTELPAQFWWNMMKENSPCQSKPYGFMMRTASSWELVKE